MSKKMWDKQFSAKHYVYGETPNAFIKEHHHLFPKGSKIAAFAEGEGRNAAFLAKEHYVTAFDQSVVGLEKTRKLGEKFKVAHKIETVEIDLTEEKVTPESFDGAILVFGHVPENLQPTFFENIYRSLKPGGLFLFEVYSEKQLEYRTGGPGDISLLYSPELILSQLKALFPLHFYYGEAVRHEGDKHTGRCHVIQGIFRK